MGTSEGGTYKSSRILHARTSIFAQICARRPLALARQTYNKIFYDRNSVLSTTCERPHKLRGCSQIWFKSVNCKSASSELSFSGPAKFRKKGHKLTDCPTVHLTDLTFWDTLYEACTDAKVAVVPKKYRK